MANYQDWKTPIVGGTDYVQKWALFVQASEDRDTELENARQGRPTLLANLQSKVDFSGATAHLNMGGFRITGGANAVNATDFTTLQQVNALILGGGSPSNIAITSLNVGTLVEGQVLGRLNGQLVGVTQSRARNKYFGGR